MDQSQMPQDAEGQEAPEQFSVTITSNGDGTYTVSSSDSEPQEGEESGDQSADSVDQALEIAGQLLQEEQGEGEEGQEDGNAPIPQDQQKAVWDQMAAKRGK